ncbi:hypothetical protein HPO96_36335 [Kribbella sandramycini]|uniref:Lipoprotein LprG n=1 Tax=Kribbella sandramycini TaxID=60450 RepID=A0A7Y4L7D4_9ACTN|nr:hypothetical protein [Kribbella sandramycini]MBB6567189.1 hypothetical protein [Kribbella sandramycini]NOL45727.1 hypothetical protein [Kribbella sandramycini]
MSFPWIRSTAAGLLIATAAVGCGSGDSAAGNQPSTPPPASASTPTPTPTPTPTTPDLSTLAAPALFAKAKGVAQTSSSFRVRGSFVDAEGKTSIDVHLTKTGGQGLFTTAGVPTRIIVLGKTVYLQMTEKAVRQMAKEDKVSAAETEVMVKLMSDKWIKLSQPKDSGFQALVELATRDTFIAGVFVPSGKLTKTAAKTVDGVPAIGLNDGEGTLWVDRRTAQPVQMESGGEALRFSDFNRLTAPKAPPAADTLDGKAMGL